MMQYLLHRALVVSVVLVGFAEGFLLPYIVKGIENLVAALLQLPLGYNIQGKN